MIVSFRTECEASYKYIMCNPNLNCCRELSASRYARGRRPLFTNKCRRLAVVKLITIILPAASELYPNTLQTDTMCAVSATQALLNALNVYFYPVLMSLCQQTARFVIVEAASVSPAGNPKLLFSN